MVKMNSVNSNWEFSTDMSSIIMMERLIIFLVKVMILIVLWKIVIDINR